MCFGFKGNRVDKRFAVKIIRATTKKTKTKYANSCYRKRIKIKYKPKKSSEKLEQLLHLSGLQPWATWAASSCMGSLCASRRPNTPVSSFLVKVMRTRAWPKTTATPLCTASRNPAPKTTPTSSHLLPLYTFPTYRKSSDCRSRNVFHTCRTNSGVPYTPD